MLLAAVCGSQTRPIIHVDTASPSQTHMATQLSTQGPPPSPGPAEELSPEFLQDLLAEFDPGAGDTSCGNEPAHYVPNGGAVAVQASPSTPAYMHAAVCASALLVQCIAVWLLLLVIRVAFDFVKLEPEDLLNITGAGLSLASTDSGRRWALDRKHAGSGVLHA